ncbi:MAG: insulinase family protein [Sphingomonas sp.]|uniref:M16 family metallopeptidase n=1 Tax=Sphingomonas sp. TaxID=28214 RepID=UPI001B12452D|nr:pitrilysin family protein [Sphingomonas sp.]MBO9622477.1 insulinase family protein [Sphingomonas sp.]
MSHSRLLKAALAAATCLATPVAAQEAIPYEQFVLPNGLRVVVHEDHKTPKVAVAVWYHVGSMNEPQGKSGFAHLFEHLMFNGSEHHDKEYMPPLQEVGVSAVNGATASDQTYYYEVVPTGGLERVLWLESDRMGYLLGAVTQAKLDEQRAVVQNEKRTREGQPYALMDQRAAAALFPIGHPYHHPVIGSMEDLNAASLEDVKDWFRDYYGAGNAVLTLTGDVTAAQAKALAGKYFGSVAAGPPVSRVTAWVPALDREKREVMRDNVPQAAVARSWAVPGRGTPEAPALRMAAQILGRGKTSRLNQALVQEQQIATYASASYAGSAVAGTFTIDVRLKDGVDPARAEAAVAEVLRSFLEKGPTAAELERTKVTAYGDSVRAMESLFVRAMALSDGALKDGNPGLYAEDDRRFAAVTAAEVRSAAGAWLAKPAYQLTVLPYGAHSATVDAADRTKIPPLGPSPALKLPELQEAKLSNGIRVRFTRRPGTPTIDLAMAFDAGSAAEQHFKRELGGFTLGLMDDGTRTLDDRQFAERQAMLGARMWASGSSDTTDFALSALTRKLPESIALWADYIRNPGFRPADLERERALHLSGLQQSLSDPNDIAQRVFTNLLYGPDHAYGTSLAGRADALRSITRDDVVAFHESWIRPDNAVIHAAGDVELPVLLAALEKAFGDWKAPARAKGSKTLDAVPAAATARIILVDKPGASQSVIRVGQVAPPASDAHDFDLHAMNDLLGGGFTARLNMNLREGKGWTYGANSYVDEARGPQVFGIATSIQTDKTADALAEIATEVRAIGADRPVEPREIELLTKGEVLSLPGQFETNQAMVGYLQATDRLGRPYDYVTGLPDRYARIRPETVTAAAHTLRPDALTWVVVGDLAKIEQKVRGLGWGNVEVWDAEGRRLR